MKLDSNHLKELVAGGAVAIRGTATLEPAGGPGDKVFPPTHAVGERDTYPGAKYALEDRRIGQNDVKCVLLDSVQSQANRMEESLQELWAKKRIALPVLSVDFSAIAPEVGRVTSLSAPHRVADALLRDSLFEGKLFRLTELGRSFADANTRNATALFKVCPTALVFGLWDSSGPKGALGTKFQRSLVSEIIGINAVVGKRTESRIDPLNILKKSATIYVANDPNEAWTIDKSKAKQDNKNDAIKYKQEGRPANILHGNVPPSIDSINGGVTIDEARHTVVLSLASLRRLGFASGAEEARTVLAALGLLAVFAAENRGHDLRSRCLLVPKKDSALRLEAVSRDGSTTPLELDLESAVALYNQAAGNLPIELKFTKAAGEVLAELQPSPKLADLVKRSRELTMAEAHVRNE